MTAPRWMSPAQAAEYAGFSEDTIGAALRGGQLQGFQRCPGGRWRIAVEDVDAWLRGEEPSRRIPTVTRRAS